MTNRTHVVFLLIVLAVGLSGCNGAGPTSPTLPQQTPIPAPAPPTPPSGPGYHVADVTLSGMVFEVTPTGRVPIDNVRVFLSDDQDLLTDQAGASCQSTATRDSTSNS